MKSTLSFVLATGLLVCFALDSAADESGESDDVYRYHSLQVAIRSWNPNDPVQTHKRHSKGSCSHGGVVGLGVDGKNGFNVEVRCISGHDRIVGEVKIVPSKSNVSIKASQAEYDLSDMRSDFLEVSKDEDGRVYFVIIQPEIHESKLPAKFDIQQLSPYDWDFPSSPVILNDETYVGRIGMSGGSLVGIEIAGVVNLEFSLLPLKGAKPIGTLQGGTLTIRTDGNAIVISGVRNGAAKKTLEGPYKVWVRQLENSSTTIEVQDAFREQLQLLEKRQAEGDKSITADVINRIRDFIKTGRPMLLGSSARDVSSKELSE